MEKFAFIIHPIEARRDIARKGGVWAVAKYLPEGAVEWGIKFKKPIVASHITGIQSPTGAQAEGWFIGCPLTPRQMLTLPQEFVYNRIIQCGELAQQLGAKIVGLGAFTSVVGDGGITVAKHLDIPVTTGNSYTIATAVEGTIDAAHRMGLSLPNTRVAVVGASGSIGRTCAMLLAPQVGAVSLIGTQKGKLEAVAAELDNANVSLHDDVHEGLREADIIITVTSARDAVIYPRDLKPGSIVCDVARPRDVSKDVARERDDVLVIEGGVISVPGADANFNFHFGFPPKTAYACMSETIMLALDGRYESFTLGKTVSPEQALETQRLAQKHGFKLAGYRSFERAVKDSDIEAIRARAEKKSGNLRPSRPQAAAQSA